MDSTLATFLPGSDISFARLCLSGAEVYQRTNVALAEKLYRRALQSAIQIHGADSPTMGLVLLSFGEFLEVQGRAEEAQSFFPEIRKVCARIAVNFADV